MSAPPPRLVRFALRRGEVIGAAAAVAVMVLLLFLAGIGIGMRAAAPDPVVAAEVEEEPADEAEAAAENEPAEYEPPAEDTSDVPGGIGGPDASDELPAFDVPAPAGGSDAAAWTDAPAPASPAPRRTTADEPAGWELRLQGFASEDDAIDALDRVRAAGYEAVLVSGEEVDAELVVRVEGFADRAAAQRAAASLADEARHATVVPAFPR